MRHLLCFVVWYFRWKLGRDERELSLSLYTVKVKMWGNTSGCRRLASWSLAVQQPSVQCYTKVVCVCVYPMGAHVEVLRIFFYFARVLFSHVHFLFTVSCTSVLFSSNLSFRTVFFPFSTVYNILVIIARWLLMCWSVSWTFDTNTRARQTFAYDPNI